MWRTGRSSTGWSTRTIRTGISWRDLPERYGSWQTVHPPFRRYALDGVFTRALQHIQASADSAGNIDWLVQIDSTIIRAHQLAAATGRNGGSAARTNRTIAPSADPEEALTTKIHLACDGRGRPRDPDDTRPTPRRHLCTPPPGTHRRPTHRRWTTALQTRPGHRRQGLQLPRLPRLSAPTRHSAHHPGGDRPAAPQTEPR